MFAHVPLILGPDKKRLSKRHGATAVGEYETQGYLPDAMVNFLALLGWSPGSGDRELFSREELIATFDLEGISGGNAVFNTEKLDWFNQRYIAGMTASEIIGRIQPGLSAMGLWKPALETESREWLLRVIELIKPRVKRLTDFAPQMTPFLVDRVERDPAAAAKHLADPAVLAVLPEWRDRLSTLSPFDAATLEPALRSLAETRGLKAAALIHATRVAVVGQTASPGIFEVLDLVGRDRTVARLDDVLAGRT